MKKMLLAAVALCCTLTLTSAPISPKAARQAAAKFLQARGIQLKGEAMRAQRMDAGLETPSGDDAAYYVFNASASKGFVVVSGDDCVGDNLVLGYSAQGSFDADCVPDNFQGWLDMMEQQITLLSHTGAKARRVATHAAIAPMMTTQWGQSAPFNNLCPKVNGQLSVTGCMATALGQIFKFHRWPQGELAGPVPGYQMEDGRVIDDLPPVAFDWDNMLDVYPGTATEAQQTAVATLMRYCGQVIQMDYTPQISNGLYYDTDLLVNLFGYSQDMRFVRADNYTVSGWDEMMYNELSEGRPFILLGSSGTAGHAFVIHGYEVEDGTGYYHVNWGWNGKCDGLFLMTLLNPDMSGTGDGITNRFNMLRRALIGIKPALEPEQYKGRYLIGDGWNMKDSLASHDFTAVHTSCRPGAFSIALAERAADGTTDLSRIYGEQVIDCEAFNAAQLLALGNKNHFQLPQNLGEELAPGHHNLVFVNREMLLIDGQDSGVLDSDVPWRDLFGPKSYIEVNVGDDGQLTDTLFHPIPQFSMSAEGITISGLNQANFNQVVTAPISNSGDDSAGSVYWGVGRVENDSVGYLFTGGVVAAIVESGGTGELAFKMSIPEPGNYVLIYLTDIIKDESYKLADLLQEKAVLCYKTFTIDPLAFYCKWAEYNERPDESGNPGYFLDIALANETPLDYAAAILARLYKPNDQGGYDPIVFPTKPNIYVKAFIGANTEGYISISLPEPLEPGSYGLELLMANDFKSALPSSYFVFSGGPLTVVKSSGINELPVEDVQGGTWYDLHGRKLSAKPSAKGVYLKNGKKQIMR